jgi:hypothetical protein
MRFRFLIVDVMLLVIPCAVAFTLIHEDPSNLDHVVFSLYLVAICVAGLGAKFRRGNRRLKMFWKGFAFFGWIYLFLGLFAGLVQDQSLVLRSVLGLALAVTSGYFTMRLVTRDPCPGLRRAEGTEPAAASGSGDTVDFNLRSA